MWWGKIIGFAIGLIIASWPGALIGLILGHLSDVVRAHPVFKIFKQHQAAAQQFRRAFFDATFLVMGHIAKADGQVSEEELNAARVIMQRMALSDEQKIQAMRLFNDGKSVQFDLDSTLTQLTRLCHGNMVLLQMFVDLQIQAVRLSNSITPEKQKVLQHIFQRLGYVPFEFGFAQGQQRQRYYQTQGQSRANQLTQAYALLGVTETASNAEVKRAYRKLMSQHHPDKLIAKGLPEEMMKLATEKAQNIQLAYDLVCETRQM